MARAKKTEAVSTEAEPNWVYGVRTWEKDGTSRGSFKWDLEPGSRTSAPDWKTTKACGNGLHANRFGMGDWSLLGDLADVVSQGRVFGLVRYDLNLAIDLDGKDKAPWMEVVMTTRTAGIGTIMGALAKHRNDHLLKAAKAAGNRAPASTTGNRALASTTGDGALASTTGYGAPASTTGNRALASTTGDGALASTTGYGAPASTTGDGAPASTTGYGAPASTAGKHSIAAALGEESRAKAAETGAIMLAAYKWVGSERQLVAVFAGMVGQTFGAVTIKPDTYYALRQDGTIFEVAS